MKIEQVLSDGIVAATLHGDTALWVRRKARKEHRCVSCDSPIRVGMEAFGPVGNQHYRSARACLRCVSDLAPATEGGTDA